MGDIVDKGLDIVGKGTGGWFGLDSLTDGAVSEGLDQLVDPFTSDYGEEEGAAGSSDVGAGIAEAARIEAE